MQDGEMFNGVLILECPKCGLQRKEVLDLPVAVEHAVQMFKAFDICADCGSKGSNMLTGQKFRDVYYEMERLGVTRLKKAEVSDENTQ